MLVIGPDPLVNNTTRVSKKNAIGCWKSSIGGTGRIKVDLLPTGRAVQGVYHPREREKEQDQVQQHQIQQPLRRTKAHQIQQANHANATQSTATAAERAPATTANAPTHATDLTRAYLMQQKQLQELVPALKVLTPQTQL